MARIETLDDVAALLEDGSYFVMDFDTKGERRAESLRHEIAALLRAVDQAALINGLRAGGLTEDEARAARDLIQKANEIAGGEE